MSGPVQTLNPTERTLYASFSIFTRLAQLFESVPIYRDKMSVYDSMSRRLVEGFECSTSQAKLKSNDLGFFVVACHSREGGNLVKNCGLFIK